MLRRRDDWDRAPSLPNRYQGSPVERLGVGVAALGGGSRTRWSCSAPFRRWLGPSAFPQIASDRVRAVRRRRNDLPYEQRQVAQR